MAYRWQSDDLVLLGIGLSLGIGAVVGLLTPVPPTAATVVFAGIGALLVGHGLFVNGPIDTPSDPAEPVDVLN